ncbi:hypothetical protein L6164_002951 [Bauhinia variegata]|uniref:Uncharacterized protein n=1 Tax=Bauhinia variegata TaxID=167791 RepID=A0ACB9PZS3_BAUVA|nr:hypothetical protein L6164_002951 [Bauhinia variegata]
MPRCCSCFPLKKCTHSRSPSPRPISSPQTDLTDDDEFHSSPSYDVFISCIDCYQDNRMGFFYHLLCSLQSAGLAVYRDVQGHRKGLLRANFFSFSPLKDIERSRVCIVIFSSAFATSRCCLEEVEKIVEFHTTIGQIVLPIFYNVEQREVRRQRGTFGKAFVKLSKKISASKEKQLSWRRALTKAAKLKGWHLTDSLR